MAYKREFNRDLEYSWLDVSRSTGQALASLADKIKEAAELDRQVREDRFQSEDLWKEINEMADRGARDEGIRAGIAKDLKAAPEEVTPDIAREYILKGFRPPRQGERAAQYVPHAISAWKTKFLGAKQNVDMGKSLTALMLNGYSDDNMVKTADQAIDEIENREAIKRINTIESSAKTSDEIKKVYQETGRDYNTSKKGAQLETDEMFEKAAVMSLENPEIYNGLMSGKYQFADVYSRLTPTYGAGPTKQAISIWATDLSKRQQDMKEQNAQNEADRRASLEERKFKLSEYATYEGLRQSANARAAEAYAKQNRTIDPKNIPGGTAKDWTKAIQVYTDKLSKVDPKDPNAKDLKAMYNANINALKKGYEKGSNSGDYDEQMFNDIMAQKSSVIVGNILRHEVDNEGLSMKSFIEDLKKASKSGNTSKTHGLKYWSDFGPGSVKVVDRIGQTYILNENGTLVSEDELGSDSRNLSTGRTGLWD